MTTINPANLTRFSELPEKLSVSRRTTYKWIDQGLRRVWLGTVAYVSNDDLAAFARVEESPSRSIAAPRKSKILARLEAMEAKRGNKGRKKRSEV